MSTFDWRALANNTRHARFFKDPNFEVWTNDAIEEYTKAIVLECSRVCQELQFSPEGPSDEVKYQRFLCSRAIEERFGLVSESPAPALNK